MNDGCGCSGKITRARLLVSGQEIGIAELDKVLMKVLEDQNASDEVLKTILMAELKKYNYVPPALESDYREALWQEFLRKRGELKTCGCC